MGDDASDNLSNENWQLIADLGDSPIISADVTSPDLNAYFGASLNFSPYGYYGKRNGDEKNLIMFQLTVTIIAMIMRLFFR